ncbi:MAG: ComEC/Rec2 family competence protein [Clostridia bacterium]|nr:ComEC/Rec2 family competence protein [Clostridia bacterium]
MNFYRRRPLAAAISLCIAVSAAAAFLTALPKLILIAAVILAVPIAILILRRRGTVRICNLAPTVFVFITAAITLCMLLTSFAYFNVYAAKYESLTKGTIRAAVTEVKSHTAYNAVYEVRLQSLDGERAGALGLVYTESSDTFAVGDVVEAAVVFSPLEEFYDFYDVSRLTMLADGYVFVCDAAGQVDAVGKSNGIEIRLEKLREMFSAKMSLYLDGDSTALADALLLGDRDGLGRIRRDFNYIGVIHILALSGLHLSVMCGGLERLFIRLGLGRRLRYVLVMLIMLFYVALTGFLMSVVRAAVMLMLTFAASFFDTESDKVTALFIAVWVITFVSPAALFDVSLQLSFCATLGVLLMTDAAKRKTIRLDSENKAVRPILGKIRSFLGSVAASVGATLFVLPLQWLYFGEISTLSVPATVIMSYLCEGLLLLLMPYLVCALMGWHFICGRLGWLISALCKICSQTAEALSEHARLISLEYPFALPIIVCLVCVIIWMMAENFPSWLYALIPFAAASAIFLTGVHFYDRAHFDTSTLNYTSYGKHDAFLLVSERQAMIIDATDGSGVLMGNINDLLAERYLTEADTLMLTNVDRRHVNAVRELLRYRRVRRLLVPTPSDDYDSHLLAELYRVTEEYGTETVMYSPHRETVMSFGDVTLSMPGRTYIDRSVQPLVLINFTCADSKLTYAGSAAWESDYVWSCSEGAKYLILGVNGPNFKTPPSGTADESLEYIAVSSKERLAEFADWLDGFSGVIMCEEPVCIDFSS